MESLSISSRSPLPRHHPAIRRIDLAPARLRFPRYHTVRCSCTAYPPNEREGNKEGRWKAAAAGTAIAVTCALGTVYLSCAASTPPAKLQGTESTQFNVVIEESEDNDGSPEINDESSENSDESPESNGVLDRTRDEVREILFKKGTCGVVPNLIESWIDGPMGFDAALMVVQWHLAKKDYHAAEEICKKIIEKGSEDDARPRLLMAVIKMMLTVEAMMKPETGEEEMEAYVKSAMDSWKQFRRSIGSEIPKC